MGLIGDWPGLVSWGVGVSTSKGWLIFFGLLMFAFAGAIQLGGWRWLLRIQNLFFWMVTASLLICGLVALFQSKSSFISNFNDFAQPITGNGDAYTATIRAAQDAGVDVSPAFSLGSTIPIIAVFATTAIFSYWSTFVGGELRQASTIKTANNMALGGVIPLVLVAIFTAIFFKTFGGDFMRAANGGGLAARDHGPRNAVLLPERNRRRLRRPTHSWSSSSTSSSGRSSRTSRACNRRVRSSPSRSTACCPRASRG